MPKTKNKFPWGSVDWWLDKFATWWPYVTSVGIGGLSGCAASVTQTVNQHAPLSWVFSTLIGAFLFTFIYWLFNLAMRYKAERDIIRSYENISKSINPLEQNFSGMRININDFKRPVPNEMIKDKTFTNCELVGPATVLFSGGHIIGSSFNNCDFVEIKEPLVIHNVLAFHDAKITSCSLYNLTIFIPDKQAHKIPKDANWVTKGPQEI